VRARSAAGGRRPVCAIRSNDRSRTINTPIKNKEPIMAMYMLMAKYSAAALKGIIEKSSDREAVARQAIEAAGGKLHGFYGMFGQEYGLAMIIEAPGHAEYIGGLMPAIGAGTFESYKTIPLYTFADVGKAIAISKKAAAVYKPPMG
jgi:uncharacterized protein with GYD domain